MMITSTAPRLADHHVARPKSLSEELYAYYRTLLRNLRDSAGAAPLRAIGLTSCQRGAGVSSIACHLALTAAVSGDQPVLLVDGNLAWPALFRLLGVTAGPGLAEVLLDGVPLGDALQPGPTPHLSVLTAGARSSQAGAIYDAPDLCEVIETLKETHGLVIFDLPPLDEVSGALSLVKLLDGVVLVLEAGRTSTEAAKRLQQRVVRAQGRLVGAVLNKSERFVSAG